MEIIIKRPLLMVMVAVGLGELTAAGNWQIMIGAFISLLLWCVALSKKNKDYLEALWVIYVIIFMMVGFFLYSNTEKKYEVINSINDKEEGILQGNVADIKITDKSNRVMLSDASYIVGEKRYFFDNVYVYLEDAGALKLGNTICADAEFHKMTCARNEGNFDEELYYHSIGIDSVFYGDKFKIISHEVWKIKQGVWKFSVKCKSVLYKICDKRDASVLCAMLLGDKSDMDSEIKELYQDAGIFHLCCISGTHMAVIGLGLYHLLRKRFKFLTAGSGAIGVVILYGIMTGFGVSVTRAAIMLAIRVMADIIGRTYDMISSISAAAILIIISNPYVIYQSGFQLSFAAVAAVCVVYPQLEKVYMEKGTTLGRSMIFSMSIQLATFPIVARYYYVVPVYGIILNLIVIPCVSWIIMSGIAGIMIGMISVLAGKFAVATCSYGLKFYNLLSSNAVKLPLSQYVTGQPSIKRVVIYYLILQVALMIAWLWYDRNEEFREEIWQLRYGKRACGALMLILLFMCICYKRKEQLDVKVIDVGQGDSICVNVDGNETYLVDGGSTDIKDVGKYRIIPCLMAGGIRRIDYVVVTHSDADHVNGLESIMDKRISGKSYVSNLVIPEIHGWKEEFADLISVAERNDVNIVLTSAGKYIDNSRKVKCIYPIMGLNENDVNEMSTVLEVKNGNMNVLFMGDLGSSGESELLKMNVLEKCIILKVGHHGSKNSSSKEFLEKVRPKIALISCGIENSYGHPNKEAVDRLKSVNGRIWVTSEKGELFIKSNGSRIKVESFLE